MEAKVPHQAAAPAKESFTTYQIFVIAILAFLQFTVILDFMVMSPLGDFLIKDLHISPKQFSWVVSAYAFSAGGSAILAAGFADKFDRKKLLMFFYTGFVIGTLLCGIANSFYFVLIARIVTGIFGGVVGSVSMAIVTDLFKMQQRGRVMGFIQMAFAASQVLGIPIGLSLANMFDWHSPFLLIVAVAVVVGIIIMIKLKPVTEHLKVQKTTNPFQHLSSTIKVKTYRRAFLTTALLSIGGFLMMPFSTQFAVNNLGVSQANLIPLFVVVGLFNLVTMPIIGKIADKAGKLKTFYIGSVIAAIMIVIYVNLSPSPLWVLMIVNGMMMVGIMSRMIPSTALMSGIPSMQDRGAFMAINSSTQQVAGGIAAVIAGFIIIEKPDHSLIHFDTVGYIGIGVMVICGILMYTINTIVSKKLHNPEP